MPKPNLQHSRYMPGLDGLRAVAVMAVIAYHLGFGWASGGLLGVGVFFVLSGYLITDLIVAEWQRNGSLNLKDFWIRRARRLLPAMLLTMTAILLILTLFDRSRLPALTGDVWSAVTYTSNWYLIFHKVSYFESFGPPSPFGHLWSLAVEEQFYLLWPLILLVGLKVVKRRGHLALLFLAGAAASALAMAIIYEPGSDPSRVYYGTDTRAFGLLIGAALAILWPSSRLQTNISNRSRTLVDLTGTAGLLVILFMMRNIGEYDAFLYRGGMVLLSLAAAVTIAALAHPGGRIGSLLGCKPLRWIGVRSYSIYLWHYPVIVLTNPSVDTGSMNPLRILLQLAISVLLAALSYKYVENPIRRGALGRLWTRMVQADRQTRNAIHRRMTVTFSVVALLMLCVSCTGDNHEGVYAGAATPGKATSSGGKDTPSASPAPSSEPEPTAAPSATPGNPKPTTKPSSTAMPTPTPKPAVPPSSSTGDPSTVPGMKPPADAVSGEGVTAIGDSVMLDAKPYLEKKLPGIVVDGKVGRQMKEAQEVIDQLRQDGKLGSRIIIELGTNGSFTKKQLVKLLDSLDDAQQIILMNTRVPRKWQETVNDMLAEVAKDYPQAVLVDWYASSEGHDEYFGKDGVHLGKTGSTAYADLVVGAVAPVTAKNG